MKSLKSPVGTHCVGLAYNLAGFLLAAGEKVKLTFCLNYICILETKLDIQCMLESEET